MNLSDDHRSKLTSELAYRMYEQDGKPDGKADEHWERAERALGLLEADGIGNQVTPQPSAENFRI